MSDRPRRDRSRTTAAATVSVLVVVAAAATIVGLVTAGATPPGTRSSSTSPAVSSSAVPVTTAPATATPTASATATSTARPKPTRTSAPAPQPQPTRTASIAASAPAAIRKELNVRVVKMEAVAGQAEGPGEIAGPSVRFTIRIDNTTGASISLANTVVNAYFGADRSPAVQLLRPGGRSFPTTVADGASATGVFVFNIAKAERDDVQVTVDTSVKNPVVAFEGAAPRS